MNTSKAKFFIGNNVYVIEQSASGKTYKVSENADAIHLTESISEAKEVVRVYGLKHLQLLSAKAKDDWMRLAYGYVELFLEGAPYRPFKAPETPILLPDLSKENCNCVEVDPHNCNVHGLESMRVTDEERA